MAFPLHVLLLLVMLQVSLSLHRVVVCACCRAAACLLQLCERQLCVRLLCFGITTDMDIPQGRIDVQNKVADQSMIAGMIMTYNRL